MGLPGIIARATFSELIAKIAWHISLLEVYRCDQHYYVDRYFRCYYQTALLLC
jgi:hypothetical protein